MAIGSHFGKCIRCGRKKWLMRLAYYCADCECDADLDSIVAEQAAKVPAWFSRENESRRRVDGVSVSTKPRYRPGAVRKSRKKMGAEK